MDRRQYILTTKDRRIVVARMVAELPQFSRVEIKAPKRTLPQNDRFWAMLTDVAEQLPWHGLTLTTSDWKLIFLDALNRETRIVPNIDGTGFVNLKQSSSDLSVEEMGDLMTLIEAFGASHGVVFHDGAEGEGAVVAPSRAA